MKITVWSMTIDHKHGIGTTVHATEDAAWAHLQEQFLGDEIWLDGGGQSIITVTEETTIDQLSEALTNGYNEVSFYGPDPTVIDVPVEVIHQRDPDGECGFSYYADGQRVGDDQIVLHTIDAGRGYEFADWAGSAASDKSHASDAAWAELEQYYAEPCGEEHIDGLPEDTEWLDHLDDTPENQAWWTANHPNVGLNYLF